MYPRTYFAARYFAPAYWPESEGEAPTEPPEPTPPPDAVLPGVGPSSMGRVLQAKRRVFVFSARSQSGYGMIPARAKPFLPASGYATVAFADMLSAVINHRLHRSGLGFMLTPTWNTSCYIISSTANAAVIGFSSPSPFGGGRVYWEASVMPYQLVSEGDFSITITHNKNSLTIPIFLTPNWNTTVYDSTSERTVNAAVFYFGAQATGDDPKVAYKIAE